MEVDVEILDVTDEEARKLLLSTDPLAALAETQTQLHERLLEMTPTPSPELEAAWHAAATAAFTTDPPPGRVESIKEQFLILVTCRDEKHQVELLGRFTAEGLMCKALIVIDNGWNRRVNERNRVSRTKFPNRVREPERRMVELLEVATGISVGSHSSPWAVIESGRLRLLFRMEQCGSVIVLDFL